MAKSFKTASEMAKEATGAGQITLKEEKPVKKETKAKKATTNHINIALTDDQLKFLKVFCKIRGESYGECIGAMIDRAQRENSELAALAEKAQAAL